MFFVMSLMTKITLTLQQNFLLLKIYPSLYTHEFRTLPFHFMSI